MDIQDLIKNAEEIKKKEEKRSGLKILIQRFKDMGFEDPYVILEKSTTMQLMAAYDKKEDKYLLAEAMVSPDLSNQALQKAYKVNNKIALLNKIFTTEEIDDLISHLGKLNMTYTKTKVIENLKN